jgi:hypothetical protein
MSAASFDSPFVRLDVPIADTRAFGIGASQQLFLMCMMVEVQVGMGEK